MQGGNSAQRHLQVRSTVPSKSNHPHERARSEKSDASEDVSEVLKSSEQLG